jgi:hypothetical protein
LSYEGKLTGHTVKMFSDNLAMFALKKLDPEYRDNFSINNFGPIAINASKRRRGVQARLGFFRAGADCSVRVRRIAIGPGQ